MAGMMHSGPGTGASNVSSLDLARERRNRTVRDRRLLRNLPLVHEIAHRYAVPCGGHEEEFVGIASVGLVHALSSYDPSQGVGFARHAEPIVVAGIERYLRSDRMRLEGMPHTLARDSRVVAARKEIAGAMSRQNRVQELAGYLRLDVDLLVDGLLETVEHDDRLLRDPHLRGAA